MLNEHQHRQSRLAGVESKLEELCGVLVVGFLLESRDWQRWDHAKVAFEVLKRVQSNISIDEN